MSDNSDYQPPIPAAVRRAAARAEELAREQGAANTQPDPEGAPAEAVPEGGDGGSVPAPPSPLPEPQPQPETQSDDPNSYSWRQRFNTLQGKFDAEVPALYNQIRSLQNVLAAMQAAENQPQQSQPVPEITPEDRELYGEELIQNVAKWASVGLRPQLSHLEAENRRLATELAQLREGQGQQSQHLVQQNAMSQLDMDPELAGRWRSLNEDPGFNEWLAEIDPYSGQQRVVLLRDAFGRGDAVRTGRFFKAYMSEHTAPSVRPAFAQTPVINGRAGQMSLDQLAAPGRAAAAGTSSGASPERRMWTNREIGAFYRDVQRGVFNGREADKNRIEQDIVTAASEGRVMS